MSQDRTTFLGLPAAWAAIMVSVVAGMLAGALMLAARPTTAEVDAKITEVKADVTLLRARVADTERRGASLESSLKSQKDLLQDIRNDLRELRKQLLEDGRRRRRHR